MAVRDIIQAAGGSAATSAATYVEDVFSTYLYTGTGASQTITNGIDLATKGGLVWIKSRSDVSYHSLVDTVRGRLSALSSNATLAADVTASGDISAFNTNGFSVNQDNSYTVNASGSTFASWTFRKQAKFFDVVTYTGDGTAGRQIAHSLGATPGMIIVKCSSSNFDEWLVYHKSNGPTKYLTLNSAVASGTWSAAWNNTNPTSTNFTVGNAGATNSDGQTYVAYLFADSNSGGFGTAGTDSVVACGSYTGNGTTDGPTINLGWEPQWLLIKKATNSFGSSNGPWLMFDNMRGVATGGNDAMLLANSSSSENGLNNFISFTSTGFSLNTIDYNDTDYPSETYIYLAIRRGPMKTPTDATKVFAPVVFTGNSTDYRSISNSSFPPDLVISLQRQNDNGYRKLLFDRLRGSPRSFRITATDAEIDNTGLLRSFDQQGATVGPVENTNDSAQLYVHHQMRRAPGFFDVVCYTGTGSATTVAHNLGVAPEMIVTKKRGSTGDWNTWHSGLSATDYILLNSTGAKNDYTGSGVWNDGSKSSTTFSVGTLSGGPNASGATYVAYLFATCPGVSKVGSYTGNGSSQTINCGFASGARFVLIKRTDSTGDWYVWDTARGIVSANDPHLSLNTTAAEVTSDDTIDPDSTGFIVNQVSATNVNVSSATYIYLAIA